MVRDLGGQRFESGGSVTIAAVIDLDVERERASLFARLKELLVRNPAIRERAFAAINEEITMAGKEEQLVIRIDSALLAELGAMVPIVAAMPEYAGVGRVTRSMVARLAIVRGLGVLQQLQEAGR